jgi:hypothetical protein
MTKPSWMYRPLLAALLLLSSCDGDSSTVADGVPDSEWEERADATIDIREEGDPEDALSEDALSEDALAQDFAMENRDPPDQESPPVTCDRSNTLGKFRIITSQSGGSFVGKYLAGPDPRVPMPILVDGPCTLYKYVAPDDCPLACTETTFCQSDGSCLGFPERLDVGTLSLIGVNPAFDASPDDKGLYYSLGEFVDWLPPDVKATLSAAGGSGIPPFELSARGIEPLPANKVTFQVSKGDAFSVYWEPAKSPSEVMVMVHLDIDYHALVSPYVECVAPDAQGKIVVPATIMEKLYGLGYSGLSTYPELDRLVRFTRNEKVVGSGCAELSVVSEQVLVVTILP